MCCGVVGYVQTIVQCCCGDHFCIIKNGNLYPIPVGDGQLLFMLKFVAPCVMDKYKVMHL